MNKLSVTLVEISRRTTCGCWIFKRDGEAAPNNAEQSTKSQPVKLEHPREEGEQRGPLKLMVVGDGMVGKSSLLLALTGEHFTSGLAKFNNCEQCIEVDGKEVKVALWDTQGQDDFDRLRPLFYPNTDCFLLCFSVGNRSSFENVATKWYPEVRHHCPHVPIVLVGTQKDLRNQKIHCDYKSWRDTDTLVSEAEGRKLHRKIKAVTFLESSAKLGEGLHEVFIAAVRAATQSKTMRTRTCTFL